MFIYMFFCVDNKAMQEEIFQVSKNKTIFLNLFRTICNYLDFHSIVHNLNGEEAKVFELFGNHNFFEKFLETVQTAFLKVSRNNVYEYNVREYLYYRNTIQKRYVRCYKVSRNSEDIVNKFLETVVEKFLETA